MINKNINKLVLRTLLSMKIAVEIQENIRKNIEVNDNRKKLHCYSNLLEFLKIDTLSSQSLTLCSQTTT